MGGRELRSLDWRRGLIDDRYSERGQARAAGSGGLHLARISVVFHFTIGVGSSIPSALEADAGAGIARK
jgi:hypothetical protein